MVIYIGTKGIYEDADTIRLESCFKKEKGGYIVDVMPCKLSNNSFGVSYSNEYFTKYQGQTVLAEKATRRSKSKQEAADEFLRWNAANLAEKYTATCKLRGGKEITLTGVVKTVM